jgi:hypothetical protein
LANGAAVYAFTVACNQYPADLNGDNEVNSADLGSLLSQFGVLLLIMLVKAINGAAPNAGTAPRVMVSAAENLRLLSAPLIYALELKVV